MRLGTTRFDSLEVVLVANRRDLLEERLAKKESDQHTVYQGVPS